MYFIYSLFNGCKVYGNEKYQRDLFNKIENE